MDRYERSSEYNNIGVQSFTAEHANLSLSGFENFVALSDPALFEAASSFSGQSFSPTYATPNSGPLSGYSQAAQQNLSVASLTSPHGTYPLFSVSYVVSHFNPPYSFLGHATAALLWPYWSAHHPNGNHLSFLFLPQASLV